MGKVCQSCGAEMKEGAKFCGKCGCEYKEEQLCPQCNASVKEGAKFCAKCGFKLNDEQIGGSNASEVEKEEGASSADNRYKIDRLLKNKNNVMKIVIGLALLIAVLIFWNIAIPLLIVGGVVVVLKKKGVWEKLDKRVRSGGTVVAALLSVAVFSSVFGGGLGDKLTDDHIIWIGSEVLTNDYNFKYKADIYSSSIEDSQTIKVNGKKMDVYLVLFDIGAQNGFGAVQKLKYAVAVVNPEKEGERVSWSEASIAMDYTGLSEDFPKEWFEDYIATINSHVDGLTEE